MLDGIKEMNREGIDTRKHDMLDRYEGYFQKSTGALPALQGDFEGSDSATESDIVDRNARSRTDISRQIAYKGVEQWGDVLWELDKMHINKVRAINVWDESTEEYQKIQFIAGKKNTLTPEQAIDLGDGRMVDENGQIFDQKAFRRKNPGIIFGLKGNYNLKVDIETTQGLNKNIIVKQLQDMVTEASQDPESTLDKDEVRKEIMKLRGIPNVPRFFGQRNSQLQPDVVGQIGDIEGGQSFGATAGGPPQPNAPNTQELSTARGQQQETQRL